MHPCTSSPAARGGASGAGATGSGSSRCGCGAQSSVPRAVCDRSLGVGYDADRGACEAAGQLRSERACAWASHAFGSGVCACAWGGQGISPVSVFPVGRDVSAMNIQCGGRLSLVLRRAARDLCLRRSVFAAPGPGVRPGAEGSFFIPSYMLPASLIYRACRISNVGRQWTRTLPFPPYPWPHHTEPGYLSLRYLV
ncbi:hypothetical protein B0H14DRAFT_2742216 [Mycena olivaceomarginata]|nr:hypothetical protein B0H14DRAFT_2742216 [Mycena olivaceomarginata]